ncbi:MAG TPA: ABC transporter ATP-binding protein [Candidatus Acidoferrum sp.]|nr:ABC transporter ATP-binding protein [Candidatus Acidoferrum sp.]
MASVLEVQNLHVAYSSPEGAPFPALAGVGLRIESGEVLGILGESGSGKSTLASALLRLLPSGGRIQQGKIVFEGSDLLDRSQEELRKLRGGRIGLILQEPSSSLHPALQVGRQLRDVLSAHLNLNRQSLDEKSAQLLTAVFPNGAGRIYRSYPHELSGGQRQRVLIAQAIACNPSLLIADEPTASLDPTTQLEILELFRSLRKNLGLAIIFITHNPALLVGFADQILVLYAGRVVETGPASNVLAAPKHPYTVALLRCLPNPFSGSSTQHKSPLPVIPGNPPNLLTPPHGCAFESRCADRMARCSNAEPSSFSLEPQHDVACYKFSG